MTFLDVPATRLTGGFLKLAEEARHSEGVDDQPPGMNLVHLKQSGWTGRTLIEEIEDGSPGSGSEESRGFRTSTEVIPDWNIAKPVIRLGPVGQNIRRMGYTNVMAKPDPVGPYEDRDSSVSRMTDGPAGLVRTRRPVGPYEDKDISVSPVTDGPAGLVRTRRPVGPYEDRDISVSPVTDGPAGLVRTRRPVGQYEDRDISVSPVTDGPAGLVRTRRPVGDVMLPALQDEVRPSAGGLMGQIPDPCVQSSPTRNESAMNTEFLPPVIKPEGEALRGRMRPSVVMKRTEPSEVKCSPEVLINTAEGSSVSPSINQDPIIRTGPDDRTNNMKLDMIKGRSDLSVVSPSSDSGVHSVDEQWDGMSTYSGESDSIQSVKTVYGSVICQTDSPVVKLKNMNSREVMDTLEERHGDQDSVPSVSTNGHNSDIADMGDFSDEENEQWEEVESSEDVQRRYGRMVLIIMLVIAVHARSYLRNLQWLFLITWRFMTKIIGLIFASRLNQAFKLDNVALAASDFPVAVKELVVRSRVTMQDINDRAERQYVEQQEWEAGGGGGGTVEPSFFYSDTDRLEDFTIPISDWCHRRSPIVDEEPTKTVFGSVTDPEEMKKMFKIADNVGCYLDPDARARYELSQTKHVIALENTDFE